MTNMGWVECTAEEPKDGRHDSSISLQKLEFGWDNACFSKVSFMIYPILHLIFIIVGYTASVNTGFLGFHG
jgi:hypothetical protein